jgi:5-methylcytosine-specific restriction endonuclease McrA
MNDQYDNLLKMPQWYARREEILKRDKNKCLSCGSLSDLQVHHRQYHISLKTGLFLLPWEYADRYLITVCSNCHEEGHKRFKIPTFNI